MTLKEFVENKEDITEIQETSLFEVKTLKIPDLIKKLETMEKFIGQSHKMVDDRVMDTNAMIKDCNKIISPLNTYIKNIKDGNYFK